VEHLAPAVAVFCVDAIEKEGMGMRAGPEVTVGALDGRYGAELASRQAAVGVAVLWCIREVRWPT